MVKNKTALVSNEGVVLAFSGMLSSEKSVASSIASAIAIESPMVHSKSQPKYFMCGNFIIAGETPSA